MNKVKYIFKISMNRALLKKQILFTVGGFGAVPLLPILDYLAIFRIARKQSKGILKISKAYVVGKSPCFIGSCEAELSPNTLVC